MWTEADIEIDIAQVAGSLVLVTIRLPIGVVEIMGSVRIEGRVLHIDGAHIDGPRPGALGRAGLNAIGRKLLEVADVDEIILQGSTRATGRYRGKVPRRIRFARRWSHADSR
jgi:hypothetical protein